MTQTSIRIIIMDPVCHKTDQNFQKTRVSKKAPKPYFSGFVGVCGYLRAFCGYLRAFCGFLCPQKSCKKQLKSRKLLMITPFLKHKKASQEHPRSPEAWGKSLMPPRRARLSCSTPLRICSTSPVDRTWEASLVWAQVWVRGKQSE